MNRSKLQMDDQLYRSRIQTEQEINRSKLQMEEEMKNNIKQIQDQSQQQIIYNSNQLISQYQSQIQQYESAVVEKNQIVQYQSIRIAQLESLISKLEIDINIHANEQNEKWANQNLDVGERIKKLESELEQSKQQNLQNNQQIAVLKDNLNKQIQKESNLSNIIQDTQSRWPNNFIKADLVRLGLKRENEELKEMIGDNIQDFIDELENYTNQDILSMKWNDVVKYAKNYIELKNLQQQYYDLQKTKLDREVRKYQSNLIPINMRQTIFDINNQQQQPQLYQQLNQQQILPQNYNWPKHQQNQSNSNNLNLNDTILDINLQNTILDQNLQQQLLRQIQQIQQNLLQSQIQSQQQLPDQVNPQNLAVNPQNLTQSIQISQPPQQQQQPQFNQQVNEVFTIISSHAHNNKPEIYSQQLIERLQALLQHLPNHQQQIQQFINQLQIAYHDQIKPSYKQIRKNYRNYNKQIVQFIQGLGFQYQKPN